MISASELRKLPSGHSEWPRITIVTPSFNQGDFIEETIKSIISQQYPNLEYFIVDGGSTDETVSVIRKYDDHIDWWVSEKDAGQTDAINKGFQRATGEIVNWINSDDILYPEALFHIAQTFMAHPEAGFVYGKTQRFNHNGPIEFMQHDVTDLPLMYYYHFPYGQQACFYKRSILEKIDYLNEQLRFSMDYDLFVRIHLHTKTIKTDFLVGGFRDHEASKTNNLEAVMVRENLGIFRCLLEAFQYREGLAALDAAGAPKLSLKGYNHPELQFTRNELSKVTARFLSRYVFYYYSQKNYQYVYQALKFIKLHDSEKYKSNLRHFSSLYRKSLLMRFIK